MTTITIPICEKCNKQILPENSASTEGECHCDETKEVY